MFRTRFLLLLAGIILGACNLTNADSPVTQSDTTTYRNEQFNFELDYPVGWFAEETGSLTMFTSFALGSLPDAEGVPSDQTKIDLILPGNISADSFAGFINLSLRDQDCISGEPIIYNLDNGGQAVEIAAVSNMSGARKVVYVDLAGRQMMFVTFGNLSPIGDIARSLRLIDPSSAAGYQYNFDVSALELPPDQCRAVSVAIG
jgi:hypothetical protein